ncbi:MAG TPA: alkaline phosphatase family protein [Planctomycetota bacterium]|nr:alkaline phosphatase family protein [Planctomycetota bacterium]
MTQRVLIVGWDGGTWDVFRPLAERGLMPRLKQLMNRGCFGVMNSTVPPVTPPAWTTLMTGLRPEKHGVFGFMEGMVSADTRRDAKARSRPVSSRSLRKRGLLDLLGDAGRHVMCINVPMTYPPRPVNGIMICDFLSPSDAVDFTWPPELVDELDDYVIDAVHAATIEEAEAQRVSYTHEAYVKRCTEIIAKRVEVVCRLGAARPWDFAITVFTGTDRVFHPLWPECVALAKRGVPATPMQELLLRLFEQLDEALGRLVDAFPDAVVMLTSDHGFQARASRAVYPDVRLEERGFLVRTGGARGRRLKGMVRRFVRGIIEKLLPSRLALRVLHKAADRQTRMAESVDRKRSVACFAGFDGATWGAVRLVEETTRTLSAEERARLLDDLETCLVEMRDPDTDAKMVAAVHRREVLFPDPVVDFLPELIVEFAPGYTGRVDPAATRLVGPTPADALSGVHDVHGMFVLAGEPVKPAHEVAALHLADVAPTVLHLCGLPVPTDMQGDVPVALLADEYLATHPVEKRDYGEDDSGAGDAGAGAYTPEQEEQVKNHLRHLGYIE